MKKIFTIIFFNCIATFAFSQNPLAFADSIGYHDCDSSQVFLYNYTPPQNPAVYFQWVVDGDIYNVGTDQTPLEIGVENFGGNIVELIAYSTPNYDPANSLYTSQAIIYTDTCSSITAINMNYYPMNIINCFTAMMGFSASPVGGTAPFTYTWTHHSNTGLFTNYYTGTNPSFVAENFDYVEVSIEDANGNVFSSGQNIYIVNDLNLSIIYNIINQDCNGFDIEFFANSNEINTFFDWSIEYNGTTISNTNQNFTMHFPANTTSIIVVLNANTQMGCFENTTQPINITTQGNTGTYTYTNLNTGSCSNNDCMYEVTLNSSGIAPFTFVLNNTTQTTATFSGLCEGYYTAEVIDANGCISSINIQISDTNSLYADEYSYFANCTTNPGATSYIGIQTGSQNTVTWSDGFVGAYYPNPLAGTYNYIVNDPISGCSASGTMIVPNTNCFTISGNVYVDLNGDCIFNNNDYALNGAWVDLADASNNWLWMFDYTDANGYFSINAPAGTYYFDVNGYNTNGFTQTCPASGFSVTIDNNNPNPVVNFFLSPPAPVQDLSISLNSITTFTPGFPFWAHASYCNNGTIPMSGSVVMNYDPMLNYTAGSSYGAVHDLLNRTLTWSFSNLMPGQCTSVWPDFVTSNSAALGTLMNITAVVNPIPGDVTPANNTAYLMDTVVGSWDPNDKAVYPNGNITQEQKDHSYTIRFQNEGTAPAVLVVVRDDLDNNLDLKTLRNVSSSHNFVLTVENTDELVFTFNNIMLPALQDDEPGSMGSISFTISQKEDLPLGTIINNTADIFFDFNEAIVTNTTENTIVEKTTSIKNVALANSIKIFPNPTQAILNINSIDQANIKSIKVLDLQGRQVFNANDMNTKNALLNLSNVVNGVYLLKIETENGSLIEKVTISK